MDNNVIKTIVGSVAILLLAACSDGGGSPSVREDNPPTIQRISDQTVSANQESAPISIVVNDDLTADLGLVLSVSSDAPEVVADAGLDLQGSDDRSLVITPEAGQTGSATITVSVTDRVGQTAETSFELTVLPQLVSFNAFLRDTFALRESDSPQTINDKEFNSDATDFNDLATP